MVNLSENCQGLTPFSNKKWDSHKEFHEYFVDRIPFFREFQNIVNLDIDEICEETGETLGKTRIEYIGQIKQQQYLADIFEYTINAPKYAVMKTLVSIDDDPGSIDRLTKRREDKKKKETKKPKAVIEELTVELQDFEEDDDSYNLIFDVINNVRYPLQNIEIRLFNGDGRELNVEGIAGGFHPIQKRNGLNLPFLKTSMDNTDYVETISIRTQKIPKLVDTIKITCELDLPVDHETMVLDWEFDL
ncbi:MAG: hypothetical protein GPJ54_20105 [Candidatus Heimdallarchaeota archaeon]|nr:hypothetical protein [Candidatus Heimdallarchaeota archaeon]